MKMLTFEIICRVVLGLRLPPKDLADMAGHFQVWPKERLASAF